VTAVAKLAHVVNPFRPAGGDGAIQQVTFETMRRARAATQERVELFAVSYPEDRQLMEGFTLLPDLSRSVLDFGRFAEPRRLPLIGDILEPLYAASRADYFIYTNADIALQPHFYSEARRFLDGGLDGFSLTRRTIHAPPERVQDLEWLFMQPGEAHPGHDCFVFRRDLLEGGRSKRALHRLSAGRDGVGVADLDER